MLVAVGQLAWVHGVGLTRWRGGGMGMYSEPHPNRVVVAIVEGDERREVEAWRCQRLPTPGCLQEVLDRHPDAEAVEVWRPTFALSTRTFAHERRLRVER